MQQINIGIDIGSTTTKLVAIDAESHECLFIHYGRHNTQQSASLLTILEQIEQLFPKATFKGAICGSGGLPIASVLGLPFAQEVLANSLAIHEYHPSVKVAIELGGQDAKIVFFDTQKDGQLHVSNMRMNGICAGGTGAFLDEIASLLCIPIESFEDYASRGEKVYEISGRCGVFAKTDIQPLLNRGVPKEDIALSTLHAIAKQTISGLAQGLEIEAPVAFMGGPITFIPTLVKVFAERLNLKQDDVIIPNQPETFIALGAALSLESLFREEEAVLKPLEAQALLREQMAILKEDKSAAQSFFRSTKEKEIFLKRHTEAPFAPIPPNKGEKRQAYLGIDSGSTTTKFVLIDNEGTLLESFYSANDDKPLELTVKALCRIRDAYAKAGAELEILGVGTTGYGEQLFAKAFNADYHVVETVAHAHAAMRHLPEVSFLLDIGGQDMKALWINDGVITNIVVNEACSSGCGSFLENFASTLNIPVDDIASFAFKSQDSAKLGSRCTVFMNSSIITELNSGKSSEDIMAGLCDSIVENVFTKVIRVSNLDSLGDKIVVQGGTFKNDAVLHSFERFVGKEVMRVPYPEMMGAIGVALLTKEHLDREQEQHPKRGRNSFDLAALDNFTYVLEQDIICSRCANLCVLMRIKFPNGQTWVSGNRCPKGETQDKPPEQKKKTPDLFKDRGRFLFEDYPFELIAPMRKEVIGIPRVLFFWETMPFWRTFFSALGFTTELSGPCSHEQFEASLSSIPSDTICFPAKLVHSHIHDLTSRGVDRIFFPAITTDESAESDTSKESMCALVKGYPLVMRNSDNPREKGRVLFDTPLFHWHSKKDRSVQLQKYMKETFNISPDKTKKAIAQGEVSLNMFRQKMVARGNEVRAESECAVIISGRPYHSDPFVNHDISRLFTELGIPVLTVDSIEGLASEDLSGSLLDPPNNYMARSLRAGLIAARDPHLEFVQLVSFGCGHDAYLVDEIVRMMRDEGRKSPLMLKIDESDTKEPLRMRIRSFVETINVRRRQEHEQMAAATCDPYSVKFNKTHKQEMTVLIPNTSHSFSRLMGAVFARQGLNVVSLEYGRENAIRLGKQYVHSDMCFPIQVLVGEILETLLSGDYDINKTAVAMAKYVDCCRLAEYPAVLRKALDDAGFKQVPIVTNDDIDLHDMHPGFKMSKLSLANIVLTMPKVDVLEELRCKIRPYELIPGSTEKAYEVALELVMNGLKKQGALGAHREFKKAISVMAEVEYDRSILRPHVSLVGEFLMSFHVGANNGAESYLERNGMEVSLPRLTDIVHMIYFYQYSQIKEYKVSKTIRNKIWHLIVEVGFDCGEALAHRLALKHPLHEKTIRMKELVKVSDDLVYHTFDSGVGVLIPAEILNQAARGVKAFVILQPFGCLPHHVIGRGLLKRIKKMYPDIQVLPLDFEPDASHTNIENRLQMLMLNLKTN